MVGEPGEAEHQHHHKQHLNHPLLVGEHGAVPHPVPLARRPAGVRGQVAPGAPQSGGDAGVGEGDGGEGQEVLGHHQGDAIPIEARALGSPGHPPTSAEQKGTPVSVTLKL